MATGWAGLRFQILCEDRRTEWFLRDWLSQKGVEARRVTVQTAPKGRGAASAWVIAHYPDAVRRMRSRSHQQGLRLLVAVDGDNQGVQVRHRTMDDRISTPGVRSTEEPIAILVPTWSIETWFIFLLGEEVDEQGSFKSKFDSRYGDDERTAVSAAVEAWPGSEHGRPASLQAAVQELLRIQP